MLANMVYFKDPFFFLFLEVPAGLIEAIELGKWLCAGGAICLPCCCLRQVGSWAAKLELHQPDRTVITTIVGCKADLSQVATRVERAGFEPATFRLQARRSNHRAAPRPLKALFVNTDICHWALFCWGQGFVAISLTMPHCVCVVSLGAERRKLSPISNICLCHTVSKQSELSFWS